MQLPREIPNHTLSTRPLSFLESHPGRPLVAESPRWAVSTNHGPSFRRTMKLWTLFSKADVEQTAKEKSTAHGQHGHSIPTTTPVLPELNTNDISSRTTSAAMALSPTINFRRQSQSRTSAGVRAARTATSQLRVRRSCLPGTYKRGSPAKDPFAYHLPAST